jgi:hypothetical protein
VRSIELDINQLLVAHPNFTCCIYRLFLFRMIVTLTTVTAICLLPGHVIIVFSFFHVIPVGAMGDVFWLITSVMLYINSLLSPILLCIISDKHRERFHFLLKRSCCYCCLSCRPRNDQQKKDIGSSILENTVSCQTTTGGD